jgi:hypothetical protein
MLNEPEPLQNTETLKDRFARQERLITWIVAAATGLAFAALVMLLADNTNIL